MYGTSFLKLEFHKIGQKNVPMVKVRWTSYNKCSSKSGNEITSCFGAEKEGREKRVLKVSVVYMPTGKRRQRFESQPPIPT